MALIRALFGFHSFIRKKTTNGSLPDTLRLKWMILLVTVCETFVRLNIAAGYIDPYEVRQ